MAFDAAAAELVEVVEEEGAGGFAGLDGEGGESVMFVVELQHAAEIDVADYVDVVKQEGLIHLVGFRFSGSARAGITAGGIFQKEPGGFFQAAAGVEQDIFAGDFDAHAEIVVGFQIGDDHVGEVVDVDDDFGDAEGSQAG